MDSVHPAEWESVACKWCGQPTTATAIKECAGCWELRHRIQAQPEMAQRILSLLRPAPEAEGERERIKQPPEPRAPVEHELKCWPEYFRAIERGVKTFEVRKNDRGFRNGDVLWLREWEPETGRYSGAEMRRKISYMTGFGQRDGYVVMALAALRAPTEREPSLYDRAFGDDRRCRCGHPYYRHFDTYENMRAVGCKYCECETFVEPQQAEAEGERERLTRLVDKELSGQRAGIYSIGLTYNEMVCVRDALRAPTEREPAKLDGVALIEAERRRQVEVEGWTVEHDDEHARGEMAVAAACYAVPAYGPLGWPWSPDWWKPSNDPIRNLTKAGALIAAEIDRLMRMEPQQAEAEGSEG